MRSAETQKLVRFQQLMRSWFVAAVFIVFVLQARAQQIYFEQLEIIDTITLSDLDSNLEVAGDNQYIFRFTNTGKQPLLVGLTAGSDPDYNCDYTREPVAPRNSGFITICAWKGRLTMDKYYTINDNSVVPQTIHIRRVFNYSDSTYIRLLKEKYERGVARYNYEHRFDVRIPIDSFPELLRKNLDSTRSWDVVIDTSRQLFSVDVYDYGVRSAALTREHFHAPRNAAFRYSDSVTVVYYDIHGNLLEERTLISTRYFRKSKEHDVPFTRYRWKIVRYPPGKAPEVSEEIVDKPKRGYW